MHAPGRACRPRSRATRTSGSGPACAGSSRPTLEQLLLDHEVVRIVLMRGTIHLVIADDAFALRPLVQPVLERSWPATRSSHRCSATSTSTRSSTTPAPSWPSPHGQGAARRARPSASPTSTGRPGLRLPQPPGPRAGAAAGPVAPQRAGHLRRPPRPGSAGRSPATPRSTTSVLRYLRRSARPRPPTSPPGRASPGCARSWSGCDRSCAPSATSAAASCSTSPTRPDPDDAVPAPVPARVRQRAAVHADRSRVFDARPAHRPLRGRRGRERHRCWSTGSCRRRGGRSAPRAAGGGDPSAEAVPARSRRGRGRGSPARSPTWRRIADAEIALRPAENAGGPE